MTPAGSEAPPSPGILRRIATHPLPLWAAFVLVHVWLGLVNLYAPSMPLGDVSVVYRFWMEQAALGTIVGIDTAWVYPIVAIVPMALSTLFGLELYASTWLSMVLLLDAVAFGFVTGWGRDRSRSVVGWWWVLFLLLLGPIALGRIDSITVPVAMVGVVLLASRPRAAAVLLTVGAWIKIWPGAVLAASILAMRQRWRMLGVAAIVSGSVIAVALLLGAGPNVLSFITQQTGRGLQVEAPVTTLWLWRAVSGARDVAVYYDTGILTYQVEGPGTAFTASLMTPLLVLVVAVIAGLGLLALRAGASTGHLLPPLALAFTTALIAINKVGSPQFVSWLAVPVVLGILTALAGRGRSWRVPAALVLVIAGLTQVIYPYWYEALLAVQLPMLVVVTARNLLYFVLLGWAVQQIVTAARATRADAAVSRRR